ncbi:hypothetical protein JCM13591A_26890 [Microbacterium xylanilyticum]
MRTREPLTLQPSPIALIRASGATNGPRLHNAHRRGELTRIVPGVYAATANWTRLKRGQQYLAKVHAASARFPDHVVCGHSAAALYGISLSRPSDPVHLLGSTGTARVSGPVRFVVSRDERDVRHVDGILVTSVPDTIVDAVRDSTPGIGLAYADMLLRAQSRISTDRLRAINEARLSSRFRARARWALERATGIPESPLESISLAVMEFGGFELPELQVVFLDEGEEDRVDFFWRSCGVIGESDGDVKYSGEFGDPQAIIRAEKLRQRRLRRRVTNDLRWGWPEVRTPDLLTTMLLRAGIPRVKPSDAGMLAALRLALR